MISKVQIHPEHTARSIYHQGLIELLILAQLQKEGRTWESLLTELGFKDNPKEKGKRMMKILTSKQQVLKNQFKLLRKKERILLRNPSRKACALKLPAKMKTLKN